jgi:hypothetical protein
LWSEDFTRKKHEKTAPYKTKIVHERQYVAEVEVDLMETDKGWSPYLPLEDAYKLDDVRAALHRRRSERRIVFIPRVFSLIPVSA